VKLRLRRFWRALPLLALCVVLTAARGVQGCGAGASDSFSTSYVPSGNIHCRGLMHLWDDAGGDPGDAETMAAIAMAESSGEQYARNPQSGAEGYWQINPAAWPSLVTYDPLGNARAAMTILAKQGLGAWAVYTSGAYAGKC
jgi:Lysozyme like domain